MTVIQSHKELKRVRFGWIEICRNNTCLIIISIDYTTQDVQNIASYDRNIHHIDVDNSHSNQNQSWNRRNSQEPKFPKRDEMAREIDKEFPININNNNPKVRQIQINSTQKHYE